MKKLTNFLLLLMMLVPLSLVSCSDDNGSSEPSSSSIVGTWVETTSSDDDDELEVTFNSNGSGQVLYKQDTGTTLTQQFEYTIKVNSDNDKIVNIVSEDCVLEGEYKVVITSNILQLTPISGSYVTYRFKRK